MHFYLNYRKWSFVYFIPSLPTPYLSLVLFFIMYRLIKMMCGIVWLWDPSIFTSYFYFSSPFWCLISLHLPSLWNSEALNLEEKLFESPYLQEKLSSINVYNVVIIWLVYLNNSFHCWLVDIHCYFQFYLVASWPFVWKEFFLHHLYLIDNIIRIKGSCKVSPYTFHCVVAFVSWTLVEFLHWEFKANGKEPYFKLNFEISCEWKSTWPSKVGVISQYNLPLQWVYKTFHQGLVFYNSSTTLCQNCYYERKDVPKPLLFYWWKIGMFNSLYY